MWSCQSHCHWAEVTLPPGGLYSCALQHVIAAKASEAHARSSLEPRETIWSTLVDRRRVDASYGGGPAAFTRESTVLNVARSSPISR